MAVIDLARARAEFAGRSLWRVAYPVGEKSGLLMRRQHTYSCVSQSRA
jgi:hypothetical protein